jgi:hypothetical protein
MNDTALVQDRRALPSSLIIGVAFGCLAMLYSLVLYRYQFQWEHHLSVRPWYAPGDIWNMVDGGRYVWDGALGYVYSAPGQSYALPLSYILMAPVSAIIDHFHLIEGLFPIPRPSAWPLVASFSLVFNIFLLDAVRRLAWDLGVRRGLWRSQAAAVVVVLVPAFALGHFEDVLALTFLLHACRFVLRQQAIKAALFLSLAISSKQWAILAVPLFVMSAPRGRRMLALVVSALLPGILTLVVMTADPRHGFQALFSPVSPSKSKTNPGHYSFFYTWLGNKTSRATRTLSVLLSPLIAIPFRSTRRPPVFLAGLSVALVVRPLFEPVNFAYYWMPAFVMAGMVGVAMYRVFRVRDWLWQTLAILWSIPHGNIDSTNRWWVVEVAFLVATWIQVARNCGLLHRLPGRVASEVRLLQGESVPDTGKIEIDHNGGSPSSRSTLPVTQS